MQVPAQTSNRSGTSILLAVRSGISHLARNAPLRAATTATTLSAVGYGAMPVAFPLLAVSAGQHKAQGGLFFSAFATGALLGSLRTVHRTSARDPLRSVLFGIGLLAVGSGFVALAPTVPMVAGRCFDSSGRSKTQRWLTTRVKRGIVRRRGHTTGRPATRGRTNSVGAERVASLVLLVQDYLVRGHRR